MTEEKKAEIEVYQTRVFEKVFSRLSESEKNIVDGEIDKIIDNPEIGERKKGDLSYLWVHKFILTNRQVLLGYSWVEEMLELYLLSIGPHENFYRDAKKRRSSDLDLISD